MAGDLTVANINSEDVSMGLAQKTKNDLNASGTAPIYATRAWVNFNGTGVVAIRASGNVSSITDNGTGNYTVNFIDNMEDANYTVSGTATNITDPTSINDEAVMHPLNMLVSSVDIGVNSNNSAQVDSVVTSVVITR